MKKFNFNSFVAQQHAQFEHVFTLNEVKDILYIGEDAYTKDIPNSTGKTLIIDSLAFKGKKNDGNVIDHFVELSKGLTIWITKNSNLKGKSSIFKIIKFALTGDNSIKNDINKWIEEILLCFTIGNHYYTIHIIKKTITVAKLYRTKLTSWEEIENTSNEPIFEAKGKSEYKDCIQDFFFAQFTYYSLKWTQSASNKNSLELLESSASWKTYFKSIYLESKDYGVLFYGESLSHQGQKVFQTLMGLELTFAINQLTIKKDKLSNENAKEKLKNQNSQSDIAEKKQMLEDELSKIEHQIDDLSKKPINTMNQEMIWLQEHKQFTTQYNLFLKLESEIEQNKKTYITIQNRIDLTKRRILELNEHLEIGILLSDLEVKNCPSCHHTVDQVRKKTNLDAHRCPLCSDLIINSNELDTESYEEKIKQLEEELKQASQQKIIVEDEGKFIENKLNELKNSKINQDRGLRISDSNSLFLKIQLIQSQINTSLAQNPISDLQREKLIAKKAVLEFQLKEIEKKSLLINVLNKYDNKINLLDKAIDTLKKQRYEIGSDAIQRLQDFMLKEINSFGITSITRIRITENFDVKYTQEGEEISFERISEGEQLRAKLAFYLSLIQLDIEYAMGKHTRFLMIDSPGKEEAGKKYMDGLINVLQDIEKRYGDKLQILIATADSRFEDELKNQFVYPEETYIF